MTGPLYAIQRNAEGEIIAAGSFDYSYKLTDWLKSIDICAGDKIEFGELGKRPQEKRDPIEAEPCEYAPIAEPINMARVAAKFAEKSA